MSTTTDMKLEILSPEKSLFRGNADAVNIPGKLGYMTILPGHAAMIAELDVGLMTVTASGQADLKYFIAGGFVEVRGDSVRVLVDVIEKPSDINVERAKKSEQRAQERLSGKTSGEGVDYARASAALRRAQTRVEISGGARH